MSNSVCKYHDYLPKEIKDWLVNNYKGSKQEVIDNIYKEFGVTISPQKLKNAIHYMRKKHSIPYLVNNLDENGKFKIGNEIGKEYRFKRIDVDEIKRKNGCFIRNKNNWQRRSRMIYEEEYGEIPKNMKVIHINGDKFDDRIENLALLSSKNQNYLASNKWFFDNKKYFDVACQLIDLKRKVRECYVSNKKW